MGLATPHHRTPIRDSHRSTLGDRRPGQHLGSIGSAVAIAVPAARDTGAGDRMANRVAADRRRSGPPRGEGAKIPADGKKMPLDKKMRPQSIGCGPSPRRKPAQSGARASTLNESAAALKPGFVLKGRCPSGARRGARGSAARLRRKQPETQLPAAARPATGPSVAAGSCRTPAPGREHKPEYASYGPLEGASVLCWFALRKSPKNGSPP